MPESAAPSIVTIDGERIALGPERRDLVPLVQRWHNDFTALRSLGDPPVPQTLEQASAEYDHHATIPDMVRFLIYERATWRPIGLTLLHGIDYRQGTATYVILIGEADCRGRGYGTEATRLMLDYAFTALGLHSVMLTTYSISQGYVAVP